MKNLFNVGALMAAAALWTFPAGVRASVPDAQILQNMIEESDLIVVGKVIAVDQPGDGTTQINLQMSEILKGSAPDGNVVRFIVPGGLIQGSATPLTVKERPAAGRAGNIFGL